jgi:CubicO group peptidase (beta-lactamase class C family)
MTSRLAAIIRALKAILFTPLASLAFITTAAAVVSVIWLLAGGPAGVAIRPSEVAGIWTGTLQTFDCPGINCKPVNLRLVLHVTADAAGKLGASLDSVDEGVMDLPGDKVVLKANEFSFDIPSIKGNYQATISADGNSLNGTWSQGFLFPLVFTRIIATVQRAAPSAELAARIQRVENNLSIPLGQNQQPLRLNLQKLMELYNVPGLSVAVVDHYKIAWAKGYGVTAPGSSTHVTTNTLFQAGSISKPVTATGALYLVEHGELSLDENVNQKLRSWKVPDNEFTKNQKVTLRRILSHSAGLTVHGFPGYEVGEPIPTLVQILNGEKPSNTDKIRVDYVPGSQERYSGGGVTIEQQLIIDVTGKPFPQFMRDTVLGKIGMSNSTYEQPLPPSRALFAASGTRGDGKVIPGKWHIYPEMAAAGLWTTPTDLAKFGIEIALSKHGKSNRVLSEASTREMLKPQIDHVGLGFFLGDDKNPHIFEHGGADEGFQALFVFSDLGQGVAVMTNSDNGSTVAAYLIQTVARDYGWNYVQSQ